LREVNRTLLRASGSVVWLSADVDTLWQRLQQDATTPERRPALGAGGRAEVAEVLRVREPLYRACAHLTIATTGRSASAITEEVLAWLARGRSAE
jgi:shikimate kinase